MAAFATSLLALLALGALAADVQVEDAKNRPVTKVINLLKDMLKQLETEGEEDQDSYVKFGCWCVTYENIYPLVVYVFKKANINVYL
jgi:hypothetical protein